MQLVKVTDLLRNADGANTTGTTVPTPPWRESGRGQVIATITGGANIASTVTVQGSLDGTNFKDIGAIALTASNNDTDTLAIDYPWPFLRAVSAGAAGVMTSLRVALVQ